MDIIHEDCEWAKLGANQICKGSYFGVGAPDVAHSPRVVVLLHVNVVIPPVIVFSI